MNLDRSREPWKAIVPFKGQYISDGIVAADIGRVGGAVLVTPPHQRKEVIYLCGPQLLTVDELIETAQKAMKREILVKHVSDEDIAAWLTELGMPPPIVRHHTHGANERMKEDKYYGEPFYSTSVTNIKKYSGYEATAFESYARAYFSLSKSPTDEGL